MIEGQYYYLITFAAGVLVLPVLYFFLYVHHMFFYGTCDACKKDVYLSEPHISKFNDKLWHIECIHVMTKEELSRFKTRTFAIEEILKLQEQTMDSELINLRQAIRSNASELKVSNYARTFIRNHNKDMAFPVEVLCEKVFDPLRKEFNSADERQNLILQAERAAWSETFAANKK